MKELLTFHFMFFCTFSRDLAYYALETFLKGCYTYGVLVFYTLPLETVIT